MIGGNDLLRVYFLLLFALVSLAPRDLICRLVLINISNKQEYPVQILRDGSSARNILYYILINLYVSSLSLVTMWI